MGFTGDSNRHAAARLFLGNRIPLNADQVRLSGVNIYADNRKAVQELGLAPISFRDAVANRLRLVQ